jgi:hypothetical protein
VGDEAFACGKVIEGVGSAKTTVQPLDLRFFVHANLHANVRGGWARFWDRGAG